MIVRLLVSNDKANVKKVVLRTDTVIGRSSDCNLRIASKEVSRRHCSILLSGRTVRVRDLGSANGTFLNGEQIEANVDVPAPPGSELEVGNVRFVINYDSPVPVELDASTAEVPNAVLAARLARAAQSGAAVPERGPVTGSPPAGSAPGLQFPPAEQADSQLDTFRGLPGETLQDGGGASDSETFNAADPDDELDRTVNKSGRRPVDDDTFALKESEVPEEVPDAAESPPRSRAIDETISMLAEDVLIDTNPAPPPLPRDKPPADDPSRKGWKSMFGLFGGKKPGPAEPAQDAVEIAAAPPPAVEPRRLDPAPERKPDPERNRKTVPEFILPPEDDDPNANRKTQPEFEGIGEEAVDAEETVHFSSDEAAPVQPPPRQEAAPPIGDSNLQDFFRQLSKE